MKRDIISGRFDTKTAKPFNKKRMCNQELDNYMQEDEVE